MAWLTIVRSRPREKRPRDGTGQREGASEAGGVGAASRRGATARQLRAHELTGARVACVLATRSRGANGGTLWRAAASDQ